MNQLSLTALPDIPLIQKGDNSWKDYIPAGADKILHDYLSETGLVIWFTGLPKSGKTTISKLVSFKLEQNGLKNERLDGSILRKTVSKDLKFTKGDRSTNLERATFIAKLLAN